MNNTKWDMVAKHIAEAAVWVALFGFGINGCVQCHRIDTDKQMQERK